MPASNKADGELSVLQLGRCCRCLSVLPGRVLRAPFAPSGRWWGSGGSFPPTCLEGEAGPGSREDFSLCGCSRLLPSVFLSSRNLIKRLGISGPSLVGGGGWGSAEERLVHLETLLGLFRTYKGLQKTALPGVDHPLKKTQSVYHGGTR